MGAAHQGIPTAGSDCTGCHQSHLSQTKGLLHEVRHPLFEERLCSECHTP